MFGKEGEGGLSALRTIILRKGLQRPPQFLPNRAPTFVNPALGIISVVSIMSLKDYTVCSSVA